MERYKVIARKWAPGQTFDGVRRTAARTETLKNAIKKDSVAHASFFGARALEKNDPAAS